MTTTLTASIAISTTPFLVRLVTIILLLTITDTTITKEDLVKNLMMIGVGGMGHTAWTGLGARANVLTASVQKGKRLKRRTNI